MIPNIQKIQDDVNLLKRKLAYKQVRYGVAADFIGQTTCCNVIGVANDTGAIYYADGTGTWQLAGGGGGGGSQNLQQVCNTGNELFVNDTGMSYLRLTAEYAEVSKESGALGKGILTKGNLNFFTFNANTIDFNTIILPAVKPVGNNVNIFATNYNIPYKETSQTFAMLEDITGVNDYTLNEVNTGSLFLGDAIFKKTINVGSIIQGDEIMIFVIADIKDLIKHETILARNAGGETQRNNGATLIKTGDTLRMETLPYSTGGGIFGNSEDIIGYLTLYYTKIV